jgi:hypothetical protein
MIRRLLPLFLAGMVIVAGLVTAQEPAGGGDGPLRLKKKKRPADNPAATKPAKDKEKAKDPPDPKDKPPAKEKAEEPLDPEDGPAGDPEEDDKEILERIGRNMRGVEEKLGHRELGDPTSQQQRDILKDLDALMKRKQQSQGGGADQQPQGGGGGGEQDKERSKSRSQSRRSQSQRSMARAGGKRQQRGRRGNRQRRGSSGSSLAKGQQPRPNQGNAKQNPGASGNNGGAGSKSPENTKNLNADLYKDVWGHLPESLRAEMNAYSNPSPFLPRYDELIKKYYRTIAEQGRKKGD